MDMHIQIRISLLRDKIGGLELRVVHTVAFLYCILLVYHTFIALLIHRLRAIVCI